MLSFSNIAKSQQCIYSCDWKTETATLAVGVGLEIGSLILQHNIKTINNDDYLSLDVNDLLPFDRRAIGTNSEWASDFSDIVATGSIVIPLSLLFTKIDGRTKKSIGIMTLESMLYTDALTRMLKVGVQRYRPYVYDVNIPFDQKTTVGAKSSFPSGHTSKTAAVTFLTASILDDIFPDYKYRTAYWIAAITIPATVAFARVKASKHFPTDVIAGYALGAAVGYFLPKIHNTKELNIETTANGGLGLSLNF
jgi:membrane-associated phospholipid phosphatase